MIDPRTQALLRPLPMAAILFLALGCGGETINRNSPEVLTDPEVPTTAEDSYANVVAVTVGGQESARSFAVSIESADTGCSRYADWWEILAEDGALVYRRILGHSHTDANGTTDPGAPGNTFTRSSERPVEVADGDVLFIRAHMNDAGYVGQVMTGTVEDGFVAASGLAEDFAADVEGSDPQPSGCAF